MFLVTGMTVAMPVGIHIGLFHCVHVAVITFSANPERGLVWTCSDIEEELLGGWGDGQI